MSDTQTWYRVCKWRHSPDFGTCESMEVVRETRAMVFYNDPFFTAGNPHRARKRSDDYEWYPDHREALEVCEKLLKGRIMMTENALRSLRDRLAGVKTALKEMP